MMKKVSEQEEINQELVEENQAKGGEVIDVKTQ
jgi:acetolactate synthase small subunit